MHIENCSTLVSLIPSDLLLPPVFLALAQPEGLLALLSVLAIAMLRHGGVSLTQTVRGPNVGDVARFVVISDSINTPTPFLSRHQITAGDLMQFSAEVAITNFPGSLRLKLLLGCPKATTPAPVAWSRKP